MRALPGVDQVVPNAKLAALGNIDLHCPIMSLPYMFDSQIETIPDHVPYLAVPQQLRKQWGERTASINRMKVGIAWAGSKTLRDDAKRSIPLKRFAPILEIDAVQFISLQKGDEAAQKEAFGDKILDWMDACHDLMDTAALVENLDLVISVDTAAAHLAGTLGKCTWLLNRFESEWRWGIERDDSPWYPTMTIFRQDLRDDWSGPIERIALKLRDAADREGPG
jgi:ADP-heptose:LPS heptosyltransferase